MKTANPRILTINGGSSSIKFALFEAGDSLRRILKGGIEMTNARSRRKSANTFINRFQLSDGNRTAQHSVGTNFCR
jgi:acetate kinase